MIPYLKSLVLLAAAAIFFVIFCIVLAPIAAQVQAGVIVLTLTDFLPLAVFFILTLACIVFAAMLPTLYLFATIPLFFPVILGLFFFLAPLHLLLVFGAPFAVLFLIVKRNIANQVRLHFSSDIRRPVTTAYLLFFFFGAFAIAPFFDQVIRDNAAPFLMNFLPETVEVEGETVSLDDSIADLVEQQIADNLAVCQGNADCEDKLRAEVSAQVQQQFTESPLFAGVEIDDETPVTQLLVTKIVNDLDNNAFFTALQERGIPSSVVWAIVIFLLISPFTILFSLVTVLLTSFVFEILKITRVFRILKQDVKQDVLR